jgi:hypothetical protein
LLTPPQRADNLVVNTMNRRGQVLVNKCLSTSACQRGPLHRTVADDRRKAAAEFLRD